MLRKFGFSFSWTRVLGISGAKTGLSDKPGIPTAGMLGPYRWQMNDNVSYHTFAPARGQSRKP